jgi:hypothetical protein
MHHPQPACANTAQADRHGHASSEQWHPAEGTGNTTMLKNRLLDKKRHVYRTSAELDEAVQRHREQTEKLLSEARNRRAEAGDAMPAVQADRSNDQ